MNTPKYIVIDGSDVDNFQFFDNKIDLKKHLVELEEERDEFQSSLEDTILILDVEKRDSLGFEFEKTVNINFL